MTAPRVSVVLPTRDGGSTLPALLEALHGQRVPGGLEIIAVDSGSTDATLEILHRASARVVSIAPGSFDHGLSRNLGISQSRGQFIILTVQDALPAGADCLERLVAPLEADATLAGTFARQEARPGASELTRHYLERWVATSTTGWTHRLPGGHAELAALGPRQRLDFCAFDNVCSCIRRSVWDGHPFRPTPIAEDVAWARDVLLAGYGTQFVPDALVRHSHDRSVRYEYSRTRRLHRQLYELLELQTIPDLPTLARAVLSSLLLHARLESQAPGRWLRSAALAVAWPLGQYLGARDARTSKAGLRLRPGVV